MLEALVSSLQNLMISAGPLGVLLGTFLGSSIIPIPSEAILFAEGAVGLKIVEITVFGAIGSTLGAVIGYYIGKWGGRPFLDRYGRYFFVTTEKLKFSDKWFKRWDKYAVLTSRIIPVIPYKVFSIASGISKINLKKYFFFTFIGSFPRCFMLAVFGAFLSSTGSIPLTIAALVLIFAIPVIIDRINSRKGKKKK